MGSVCGAAGSATETTTAQVRVDPFPDPLDQHLCFLLVAIALKFRKYGLLNHLNIGSFLFN